MTTRISNRMSEEELDAARLHAMWDHHDGGNPHHFLNALADAVDKELWKSLGMTFTEFVTSRLDMSTKDLERLVEIETKKARQFPSTGERFREMRQRVRALLKEGEPTLAEHRRPTKEEQASKRDNTNLKGRGTSASYILARLKRDRPDLAEKVINGEMTANAAAIEAGFRKKTFVVPEDVPGLAAALVKRRIDRDELYAAMGEAMGIEEPSGAEAQASKQGSKPQDRPPKPKLDTNKYKKVRKGIVVREIPEAELSPEEVWEQHLDLIDRVDRLWYELSDLGNREGNKALAKHGVGAEEYREVGREYLEISKLVKSACTTEIYGVTGELRTERELQTMRKGNEISTELGERILGLRAENNRTPAKFKPEWHS